MIMTGCDNADPVPAGEALYADAEQTYMDYREFVNGVQSVLSTDPWIVGQVGDYGMQPDQCDNGNGYQFNLGRRLTMELADREQNADAIEQYLTDAGMTPSRRTLGEGSDSLVQIAVADERGFELLLIEFGKNGNALISAATACRPGNAHDLSDMLFGDIYFLGDYLPTDVESPTDPLFFGITPGDPQFVRDTPAPTETPAP
ncbi:hypothetical protein CQ040_14405 [Microbacterium sp. MYb54]|nr:hypothetical protein CQ032_12735 [Microbacterium sp. MYb43]PQZ77529.1 hypothetical protein CQ031_11465 [Microbacterium sp. MYb40]PRB19797.1 hypothetical protein CQ040_14405 [Microbacterium sp. MYb54]PRB25831.1 hypothetical protein CQ037_13915 [Microbacterium sp. MYb50]PRB64325.1 hypothetical protein CQ021_14345 [Microbacterium sp. MYb24]PRB73054.1 hypothetical protein CQ027_13685 [Microbacterium sp. MYb32]